MNSVNLIGRWTRDHEVITGNTTVVKNTLAVDHPWKKDDTSFIRVIMFGKTGELANQYTGKGSQVAIEGHIQTGSYTDNDGRTVWTTDVNASRIKFLDSRSSSNQLDGGQAHGHTNTPNQTYNAQNRQGTPNNDPFTPGGGPIEVTDDDLPF